jgi:membrane protease YdiL (CAAX protease family)
MAENVQPIHGLEQRRRTASIIYAAIFLAVTTGCFMLLFPLFDSHLVHRHEFGLLRKLDEYSPLSESLLCTIQLFLILLFFRPAKNPLMQHVSGNLSRQRTVTNVNLGLITGIVTFLAVSPALFWEPTPSALATFFLDHLNTIPGISFIAILVILLPILSEAFFRGVFLARLLESTTLIPSLIISTLLFAWTWQVLNPIVAVILSLACGILFFRTRSLVACIVANEVLTLSCLGLLVCRALYKF